MNLNLQNPIWIAGEIRENPLFIQFTRRLSELLETTQANDPVTVLINSSGGEPRTALGIYDLLASCQRNTVGVVAGRAESSASLILQVCRKRIITRHSTMMLHVSRVRVKGSVRNAQAMLDAFRRTDDRFYAIYAERSGSNIDKIQDMAFRDLHFGAEEALAAGLVDEIL